MLSRTHWIVIALISLISTTPARSEEPVGFELHRVGQVRSEALGVGDFNGDGRLDIVAGPMLYVAPDWTPRTIRELQGLVDEQGKGYHWDFANLPLDIDGDGRLDVVSVDWFQKCIDWYRNPETSDGLWERKIVEVSTNFECADLVDIDGDGRATEILAHVKPTVWFERGVDSEGHPTLIKRVVSEKEWDFGGGVGDVNGDGRADILRPGAWYEGPADPREGQWTEHPLPVGGHEAGSIEHTPQLLVYDVNSDGLNDVITSAAHRYGIFWYEQGRDRGKTTWQQHVIDDSWSQPHSLTLADIDEDGTLDLVTGKRFYAHNGNDPGADEPLGVYWYGLTRGPQANWTKHTISYDEGIGSALSVPVVDLDGDGDLDIVVTGKWGGPAWFENQLKD